MWQRPIFLLALVLLSSHAFAQESQVNQSSAAGYINCPAGQQYVYLYQSLSTFEIMASPKCEDRVEILGREDALGGFLRVRTADGKEGYVPQSYVTATAPAKPRITIQEQTPPVPAGQAPPLAGPLSSPRSNFGYDIPMAELFGGYSYLNADTNGLSTRRSAYGWSGSLAVNVNRWFAAEAAVSGHYKDNVDFSAAFPGANSLNTGVFSFLGGPRVNLRPGFVHALVGVDRLIGIQSGISGTQNSLAGALGGGVQWDLSPHWAVNTSMDYVLTRHNFFTVFGPSSLPTQSQHNVRVSAGVVFKLGRIITE